MPSKSTTNVIFVFGQGGSDLALDSLPAVIVARSLGVRLQRQVFIYEEN